MRPKVSDKNHRRTGVAAPGKEFSFYDSLFRPQHDMNVSVSSDNAIYVPLTLGPLDIVIFIMYCYIVLERRKCAM